MPNDDAAMAEALREAVRRVGSQGAMARLLGIKQPSVWAWIKRGKALPPQHVLLVEEHTGVSRFILRPDIYRQEHDAPSPAAPPLIEQAQS
ncbi:helix-turn-helix domain-containing protein [Sphingomonas sanguinis]|uniref:transcriptional regulator n=1 Tax=Sphingomonas sanguinis TaxID=33051 RepID=UPI001C58C084|nr:YdaS family helix-turn-helix protein [Sphingomonas sanguinis]QXT34312.1 helix-turn-helix domain-containing protein [Sphingomonas sanguinis]